MVNKDFQYGLQIKISFNSLYLYLITYNFPHGHKPKNKKKLGHDWRFRGWVELSRVWQCGQAFYWHVCSSRLSCLSGN